MITKKYFVIKRLRTAREGQVTEYWKGYNKWDHRFERAKMYTKFANAKKAFNEMVQDSTCKLEILYITTQIETIDDIIEKELNLS